MTTIDVLDRLKGLDPENLHVIWGAVRGPDERGDIACTVKSVTSLLVRRALYGIDRATSFSEPSVPKYEQFLALQPWEIKTVSRHFREHARSALHLLDKANLFASDYDLGIAHIVLYRLENADHGGPDRRRHHTAA